MSRIEWPSSSSVRVQWRGPCRGALGMVVPEHRWELSSLGAMTEGPGNDW